MADAEDDFQDAEPPVDPPVAAPAESKEDTAAPKEAPAGADSQMVQEEEIPNTVVITGIPAAEQVYNYIVISFICCNRS
jgi:hypothetical protein